MIDHFWYQTVFSTRAASFANGSGDVGVAEGVEAVLFREVVYGLPGFSGAPIVFRTRKATR